MAHGTKLRYLLTGLLPIVLAVLAFGGFLFGAQQASALTGPCGTAGNPPCAGPTTTGANVCLQPLFSGAAEVTNANRVGCTANDVRISGVAEDAQGNPLVFPTACIQGSTFTLTATFEVNVTANERYDAAFIFDIDGDDANNDGVLDGNGARLGFCSESILSNSVLPAQNLDGDSCGDLNAGTVQVTFTIPNVQCKDTDGDGFLNLPNCTSWHNNAGTVCSGFSTAGPETKSKCVCDDTFQVPVRVETGGITVVKGASPPSLPEPGGEFTFSVTVTNTLQFTTVVLDRICDDRFGLIDKVASAPACPAGTIGTINSTTCDVHTSAVILAPGASFGPCEFKANVTGDPQTVTDTVTVLGHDQGTTNPRTASASAQVAIANVPPTAQVIKSLVGLACADVDYRVRVNNTDPAESLTLSVLTDNTFGSITSVHDDVLATTCSVPQTIVVGGFYECDFRARFCAGSHTDKVTGTLNDNEGGTLDQDSNDLTVNVNASVGP
jgi:hypothetical protein